jgi:hypothetical protein
MVGIKAARPSDVILLARRRARGKAGGISSLPPFRLYRLGNPG